MRVWRADIAVPGSQRTATVPSPGQVQEIETAMMKGNIFPFQLFCFCSVIIRESLISLSHFSTTIWRRKKKCFFYVALSDKWLNMIWCQMLKSHKGTQEYMSQFRNTAACYNWLIISPKSYMKTDRETDRLTRITNLIFCILLHLCYIDIKMWTPKVSKDVLHTDNAFCIKTK